MKKEQKKEEYVFPQLTECILLEGSIICTSGESSAGNLEEDEFERL